MVFVALGVIAGLAVTVGPWPQFAYPFDVALVWLTDAAYQGLEALQGLLADPAGEYGYTPLVSALVAILVVTTPGLVALALALLVGASKALRNLVATILLVGAGSTLLFMPLWQALVIVAVTFVVVPLLALSEGVVVRMPLAALVTVLSVRMAPVVYRGELPAFESAVAAVADAAGVVSPLWRTALIVVGLTPFAAAGWRLLGGRAS